MIQNLIHFLVIFVAQSFACHYSCLTCSDTTDNDCLTCSEGTPTNGKCNCGLGVYQNQICQSSCNQGYFQILDQCLECGEGCKICENNNICVECQLNFVLTSSQFCQPHCETGFYFLTNNCVSLLFSVQVSTVVYQAFNSDIDQCEVEASEFNFQSIMPGSLCQFYNNYIIFGNNQIWNQRKGSLYLSGLTYHQFIRIYFKAFFIDQWSNGDIILIFIDEKKIFQYQFTGNVKQINTVIDIKTNTSHIKSDLTFTIQVPNQIDSGYLGISNLQIISDTCGCVICNVNNECVQQISWDQSECNQNQQRIDNICIDCKQLQNRLFNCECKDGYYLNKNENICQICDSQCQTCNYQPNYCTACSINRIGPFTCSCNEGYYQNNQGECQICSEQCLTCYEDSKLCISCSNLQFTPPKCECEFQIISNSETCFKCIKQDPSVELSAQFNYILIIFDDSFILSSQKCHDIFLYESFILLGDNPLCKVITNQIKVMLGKQFQYTKSNLLLLNKTNIIMDNCKVTLKIISPYYRLSENKDQLLYLNYNFIQLTKNSSKTIMIQTNLQKIFGLKWQIVYQKEEDQNVIDTINKWNSELESRKFELHANYFNKDNNISLALHYLDFTNFENFQYLNIIVDLDNKPELLVLTQISPIYENQKLILKVSYEENQNIPSNLTLDVLNLNYSITGINFSLSQINQTIILNDFFLIIIENNLLKKGQLYQLFIEGNNNIFYYKTEMNFLILPTQLNLKIQGGSKQVSFQKDLILRLTINNFELTEDNNSFNQLIWSCRTLLLNNDCQNYLNKQIINVNNETLLNIDKLSFEPYSVVEISIQAIQFDILYSDKVVYYFVEGNLPTLKILTNNKVENQYNNDYNKIYFKLELQNQEFEADQYYYAGSIIYNYEIQAFFQLFYPEFRIQLSDYYQMQQTGNLIYKFQTLAPKFSMPSTAIIELKYKIFLKECQIIVLNNILQKNPNFFVIQVNQCKSEYLPLQYRFSVFIKSFGNTEEQKQIYLSKFKYENKFKTILLNLLNQTSNLIISVDVLDRFLGLASFNQTVILEPQIFTDQEFIKLKESFIDEEFFFQTNYFIQYLYANNLLYESSILNSILENMVMDQMEGIKIYLQLIYSCNSQIQQYPNQNISVFIEQQIEQLSRLIDRKNQFEEGYEYFSQFYTHEQISFLFDILNLLILQNNQDFKPSRILKETFKNHNKQSNILQNLNMIGEIVLKDQLPNENKVSYNYNSFSLSAYKTTPKFLNKTQFQLNSMNYTFLSVKELKLNDKNIAQGLDLAQFKNTTYSLQTYALNGQNNNSIQDGYFSYSFEMDYGNGSEYNYICMVNINEDWREDECEKVEQENKNKIVCKCKTLALTTIAQVLINFKTNLLYIFSEKNFSKISQQNYIEALFFYIQVLLTIFYIWFLFYGSKLDNIDQNKMDSSQQARVYPSEKLTEAATKKSLTQEITDNIPEVQQGNFVQKEIANSQMINSPKETHRILKDSVSSNEKLHSEISSPKSQISIPNSKDQQQKYLFNSDKNRNQSIITQMDSISSLNQMINNKKYKTYFFLLTKFYKHYHKITALYFKYDQNQSRSLRGTLIYLSLLGQMSFINWFGEIYEPVTLVILSILSYLFGLIYKKVLSCLLSRFLLATLSVLFFIFVTISTIPLYSSIFTCNLWAISFIVSVLIDLALYTSLQIIFMFWVLMRFKQNMFFKKIIKKLLDPVCFTIIFAVS